MRSPMRSLTSFILSLAVFSLSSSVALAQCSMCKAVLSSTNDANFIRGYNIGVLVLLLPPVTIFCSIFVVLKRHKNDGKSSPVDKE